MYVSCKCQSNRPDQVQVGASCRQSTGNSEAVYWKLKFANPKIYNENNRKITERGKSPRQNIMEYKNAHVIPGRGESQAEEMECKNVPNTKENGTLETQGHNSMQIKTTHLHMRVSENSFSQDIIMTPLPALRGEKDTPPTALLFPIPC